MLLPNGVKRYGPYKQKSGHLFYTDKYPDGSRCSVLVHREMMENYLGRKLTDDEVVHHVNGIPDDNRIENFEIKTPADHSRDHQPPAETAVAICPECKKEITLFARRIRDNQERQLKAGPFCGKSCAGKYSQRLQGSRSFKKGERPFDQIPHGSKVGYSYHKCRCDKCRKAYNEFIRAQRLRRKNKNFL